MITTEQDQFQRLIEPREGETLEGDNLDLPLMPFPTCYELNREQEDELVNHAMTRLEQLEREMGRDVCAGGNWWNAPGIAIRDALGADSPQATWLGKRVLFDKLFRNEVDWRPSLLGGIFLKSNLVVPAARRICRQMIARAVNYFFATSPWFAIYPVGAMDKTRADQADRYTRWKMDQAKLQRTEEQAIERAFVQGEAVIKTAWASREQYYKTNAEVLVDETGRDILGADGDYIMKSDRWVLDSVIDPATGVEVMAELALLERDGVTPQPPNMLWAKKKIMRRIVHYKGPEAKVIHYMDFLCPLDAETIQEADCVVHLYDLPIMVLADQWKKSLEVNATPEERFLANQKAVEMLRRIGGGGAQTTSSQNSATVDASTHRGELGDKTQPILQIAECHLRYDADGDGLLEDVMLVLDRKTRVPIFYDYEANVTADGLRPFSCVRVNEVPGRWYGMGAMEMFQTSQEVVDLWMNRKSFASSASGRVTFWNPEMTVEGRATKHLLVNGGETYTLTSGSKAEEALAVVYLEDNKAEDLQAMIEFFMQLMMNESGIANANDGNVAGMDSTKLATGIRNIEKSGQELFGLYLGHLEPGISESLEKMVKILMANMDQMEVYRYFEAGEKGGEDVTQMQQIDPGDIMNLELNTRILLTRRRGEQILESSVRIIELVEKFDAFSYERQVTVAPTFITMAKTLQASDADTLFTPIMLPPEGTSVSLDATGIAAAGATPPRQAAPNL